MLALVLIGAGCAVAVATALVAGRRRLRWVALAGVVAFAIWSLYSLGAACPPGRECTPGLGALLGSFVLVGWLAGVGIAALVGRDGGCVGWRTLAATGAMVLFVSLAAIYVRYGFQIARWGCPTHEELNRNQSVEDVTSAFDDSGLPLQSISPPVWLPPTDPAYRGARAFTHAAPGATVYVLVCRQRCEISRFRFGEARRVGEQRWRIGISSNNNVPVWVTEANRRSGARLLEAMSPALAEVQPYVEHGSRCYIN